MSPPLCGLLARGVRYAPDDQTSLLRTQKLDQNGRSLLVVLLVVVAIGLGVHTYFVSVLRVSHNGMMPGLKHNGILFAKRRPYASPAEVRRGDVIVLKHDDNGRQRRFVWRVIALPGDSIVMEGSSIWVNGDLLPHAPARESGDATVFRELNAGRQYEVSYDKHSDHPGLPLRARVPAGRFFVLGDNRHDAMDSTYLGAIPFENIIARKF